MDQEDPGVDCYQGAFGQWTCGHPPKSYLGTIYVSYSPLAEFFPKFIFRWYLRYRINRAIKCTSVVYKSL